MHLTNHGIHQNLRNSNDSSSRTTLPSPFPPFPPFPLPPNPHTNTKTQAEQVVLTEATTIAKTIGTKNAADLKTIVKGVAQEGLAATDHDASTVLENIVDGVEVVAGEVVKGAEKTVEAVENHPELIAKLVLFFFF